MKMLKQSKSMLKEGQKKQIIGLFESFSAIKLGYFFGSRAQGNFGPTSDYDFAVYLDQTPEKESFKVKANLIAQISLILKTDAIDVVLLNHKIPDELAYNIIVTGELIHQIEPYKLLVEPAILNRFFDYRLSLQKNKLTKA